MAIRKRRRRLCSGCEAEKKRKEAETPATTATLAFFHSVLFIVTVKIALFGFFSHERDWLSFDDCLSLIFFPKYNKVWFYDLHWFLDTSDI